MRETLGIVGVRKLGLPIAENLLAAEFPLRVYNRTLEKAAGLIEKGASPAASIVKLAGNFYSPRYQRLPRAATIRERFTAQFFNKLLKRRTGCRPEVVAPKSGHETYPKPPQNPPSA